MGLDIEFFGREDDEERILYLRGHGYLLDLIFAQNPQPAYAGYSDMIIDKRVLAGVERRLLEEMTANGFAPAAGLPSIKELEQVYLDPEGSLEELLPYYLQVTQELLHWTEEYIELICTWSA